MSQDIHEIIRDRRTYNVPFSSVVLALHNCLVLSVSRPDRSTDWGLPGGKMELVDLSGTVSDQMERTAARELKEETGTEADRLVRLGDYPQTSRKDGSVILVSTYLALGLTGPPVEYDMTPREPGILLRWSFPDELLTEDCTFADFNRNLFRLVGLIA